jgi:hypothetical protein
LPLSQLSIDRIGSQVSDLHEFSLLTPHRVNRR